MKRVSLKDTAKQKIVDKDSFIYGGKPSPQDSGKAVKRDSGLAVDQKGIKKVSCYIPKDLWIKYKTFELDQIKQGKSVSLNRLLIDLLAKHLEKK